MYYAIGLPILSITILGIVCLIIFLVGGSIINNTHYTDIGTGLGSAIALIVFTIGVGVVVIIPYI